MRADLGRKDGKDIVYIIQGDGYFACEMRLRYRDQSIAKIQLFELSQSPYRATTPACELFRGSLTAFLLRV